MLDLAIVTGATKGIGASIAEKLSHNCKNIITIGSSYKEYNLGCRTFPLQLNLIDYANVEEQIYKTVCDICDLELIAHVGIVLCGAQLGDNGGLLETNLKNWQDVYLCNIFGNLAVIKGCLKNTSILNSKLRISFFAGGGAAYAYPEFSAYAGSKASIVRIAENLSVELSRKISDVSVIAVAPGAVATDTLNKVIACGGEVKTKTSIDEPTNFIYNFVNDQFNSKLINGKFIHVRDDLKSIDFSNKNILTLRRIS